MVLVLCFMSEAWGLQGAWLTLLLACWILAAAASDVNKIFWQIAMAAVRRLAGQLLDSLDGAEDHGVGGGGGVLQKKIPFETSDYSSVKLGVKPKMRSVAKLSFECGSECLVCFSLVRLSNYWGLRVSPGRSKWKPPRAEQPASWQSQPPTPTMGIATASRTQHNLN